nr:hypothetical protein [Tanacetum cinerariifolium]
MIHNSPILLKKWTMNTGLCKEELTRIPVWVKIHGVHIQVSLEDGLSIIASQIESLTMGVPLIDELGFTIEIVSDSPTVVTPMVVTPNVEKTQDGFQTVGKKKKKDKSKSNNGGHLIKQTVGYEPKATTSVPKKGVSNLVSTSKSPSLSKSQPPKVIVHSSKEDNIPMSNSYDALDEESDEDVENVYDESANLFHSTKTGGSSSTFTVAAG